VKRADGVPGAAAVAAAYLIWGLFPLYWKQLETIAALQLIGHRILWSFVLLAGIVILQGQVKLLRTALTRRAIFTYIASAVLISVNWFAYVWAVTHGRVVEASLGYFINPLFSIVLGVALFHERLRPFQWIAVGLAAAGVLYLTLTLGGFPWLAILLAATFGSYGAVKKTAPLGSLFGLTIETGLLVIPATAYLAYCEWAGTGAFGHAGAVVNLMLAGAGIVTAVPLLLFSWAAVRVPLTTLGILQYVTPTMQFLLGVIVFREPLPLARLVGFCLVWAALLLLWLEGLHFRSRKTGATTPS
jgi:chloramphenicol-sensitive protein RarD